MYICWAGGGGGGVFGMGVGSNISPWETVTQNRWLSTWSSSKHYVQDLVVLWLWCLCGAAGLKAINESNAVCGSSGDGGVCVHAYCSRPSQTYIVWIDMDEMLPLFKPITGGITVLDICWFLGESSGDSAPCHLPAGSADAANTAVRQNHGRLVRHLSSFLSLDSFIWSRLLSVVWCLCVRNHVLTSPKGPTYKPFFPPGKERSCT